MATPVLLPDFKEFLQLVGKCDVEHLLIGGYAVGYHMSVPPLRIEVCISISDVSFESQP